METATNNQSPETRLHNLDLVNRVLSELGPKYFVSRGTDVEISDVENPTNFQTYDIEVKDIGKSSIFGVTVLRLRSENESSKLVDYIEKRPDLVSPRVRKILSDAGLKGRLSSMMVNDEKIIYDTLNAFGPNYFMRLGETYKEKANRHPDFTILGQQILPTVDFCTQGVLSPNRVFGLVAKDYQGINIRYFENYNRISIPAPVKDIISTARLTEINVIK
ncbi:MAG: hypothetical protein WCX73_03085 [Candidatus Pacearchaeota archaeon]|jgi:hypothetical protein